MDTHPNNQGIEGKLEEVNHAIDNAHDREEDAIAKAKEALVDKLPISTAPASVTGLVD
jgi:hypothetical protein